MNDVLAWADDHPKAKVLARTRAAIIAAARDLFLRLGFERTTMEGVAAEAGIGLMTLYRHFRAKPALFSTVMEAECGMVDLVPDPDALWSRPPEEALPLFGVAVISVLASPRLVALRRVVIAEAQRFPALGRVWQETGPKRGQEAVRRYVDGRMRAGEVRTGDPDMFAAAYMALLDRLPVMVMTGLVVPDDDEVAADAAAVSRLMMAAYAPDRAARGRPVGITPVADPLPDAVSPA